MRLHGFEVPATAEESLNAGSRGLVVKSLRMLTTLHQWVRRRFPTGFCRAVTLIRVDRQSEAAPMKPVN